MEQFLIEIPHAEKNCWALIRLLRAQGDLANFEWGCQSGVHTGWGIVTADNEAEARRMIPPLLRREARVVKVARLDATTITRVEKTEAVLPSTATFSMYRAFPCWW